MSLGGETTKARLATIQVPLPEDIDGIVDAVRKIVLLGEIESISISTGQPITYRRIVRDGEELAPEESTQSFAELSLMDVVRNVTMEEWERDPKKPQSPSEELLWMFALMGSKKWVVTQLLTGESTMFWGWLGLPESAGGAEQFLGARIEVDNKLPEDVFILCGGRTRNATIAEVKFALKGNVPFKGEADE